MKFSVQKNNDEESPIIAIVDINDPQVLELAANGNFWGAYRSEDGYVVVQDRWGELIDTGIQISIDGYVFN